MASQEWAVHLFGPWLQAKSFPTFLTISGFLRSSHRLLLEMVVLMSGYQEHLCSGSWDGFGLLPFTLTFPATQYIICFDLDTSNTKCLFWWTFCFLVQLYKEVLTIYLKHFFKIPGQAHPKFRSNSWHLHTEITSGWQPCRKTYWLHMFANI